MSKAEERSKEITQAALDYANNLDDVKPTDGFSRNLCIALGQAFMKGAEWADEHQAEKDLELGWEDIKEIYFLFRAVLNEWYGHEFSDEGICQEVLKRFRERKEK